MQRREFLTGCSAAIAAMAGSKITGFSFNPNDTLGEIFIYIFLRGGCDGLNMVAPVNDSAYISERPFELRVTDSGDNQGLSLKNAVASGLDFRLHKATPELKELYDSNKLAIIHAAGLTNGTRSHFDAMDIIERGSLTDKNLSEGWFTRYLNSNGGINSGVFPAIAINSNVPTSFLGNSSTLVINTLNDYNLKGDPNLKEILKSFYSGNTLLDETARYALDSIQTINQHLLKDQTGNVPLLSPTENVQYPDNPLSRSLQTLSQIIKMDLGLQVASVDYGGWDTHEHQQGKFTSLTEGLSKSLGAFYNDIIKYESKVTIMVMSEFGRRLKANKSVGTDHGHGNVMFVLGGNVKGGTMYGQWPGLENEQLDNKVDLAVTTDYRTVLSEIIVRRLTNPNLGYIFPDYKDYKPLGFMNGPDLAIDYSATKTKAPAKKVK